MKARVLKGNLTGHTVKVLGWADTIGGTIQPQPAWRHLVAVEVDLKDRYLVVGRKVLYYKVENVSILYDDAYALPSTKSPENVDSLEAFSGSFITTLKGKPFFVTTGENGKCVEVWKTIQKALDDCKTNCGDNEGDCSEMYICVPVLKYTVEKRIVTTKV